MFGFACNETEHLMPAPIFYAHNILRSLAEARHSGAAPGLGPDAKSQVTLHYENGKPVRATSVRGLDPACRRSSTKTEVREIVRPHVLNVLPKGWMCPEAEFYVNPTGRFVIGGPDGDAGLTGRKIIVDTYGGAAPHGGGAFSGKDPTKVDRSAAYAARYLAKNVVAAGLADRCTIQIAYAIGVSKPLSFYVDTHGTGRVEEDKLAKLLPELVDLRRAASASIWASTVRSMRAPRPMAISAGRPMRMAGSPGSVSIWSRRSSGNCIKRHAEATGRQGRPRRGRFP